MPRLAIVVARGGTLVTRRAGQHVGEPAAAAVIVAGRRRLGALRLMPNLEPAIGSHTFIPNPFWGGALFPLVVFGVMFAWPSIERRFTGDRLRHDLLERTLARVRAEGYATSFGERVPGTNSVAVPLLAPDGVALGSLAILWP